MCCLSKEEHKKQRKEVKTVKLKKRISAKPVPPSLPQQNKPSFLRRSISPRQKVLANKKRPNSLRAPRESEDKQPTHVEEFKNITHRIDVELISKDSVDEFEEYLQRTINYQPKSPIHNQFNQVNPPENIQNQRPFSKASKLRNLITSNRTKKNQ